MVLRFFALTFALSWGLQLPAVLAQLGLLPGPPERFLPFAGLGGLGPLLAAALLSRREPGGARALFRGLLAWRVAPGWYLLALGAPAALLTVGLALCSLLRLYHGPFFFPPLEPERLLAMVLFPLGEELGWRGYAMPRLLRSTTPVRASLWIALGWGLWHLPMFYLARVPLPLLAAFVPFFLAGSLYFTWLWRRTGGSLLLAVLAHAGLHLDNSHRALPGNTAPALAHTAAFALFALALLALDRRAWREEEST